MYNCPDCPPCKRCGAAPWLCTCESCSCPAPSYFAHAHHHARSAGSGGEYAAESAFSVTSKSALSQALSAALRDSVPHKLRAPQAYIDYSTVDGVRHTISSEPPTVTYLTEGYHRNTLKKRQAELDQIYYDLHDYKGPFGYNQWCREYELNGTQYALDRLVDLWTPEIEQVKEDGVRYFSKEFDRKKRSEKPDARCICHITGPPSCEAHRKRLPSYEEKYGRKYKPPRQFDLTLLAIRGAFALTIIVSIIMIILPH